MMVVSRRAAIAGVAAAFAVAPAACGTVLGASDEGPSDGGVEAQVDGEGGPATACPGAGCVPVMLATVADPWYLAQDTTDLFVASAVKGGLWRVAKTRGPLTTLSGRAIVGLTVSDQDVYACAVPGLFKLPKTGGAESDLSAEKCLGVALAGDQIFYTTGDQNRVIRIDLNGGARTQVAAVTKAEGIAVDDGNVYVAGLGTNAATDPGAVTRIPRNLGTPTTLASGAQPRRVALDQSFVYWVDFDDANVKRISKTAPAEAGTTVATGPEVTGIGGIAVDDTYVYWVVPAKGLVLSAPKAGGAPLTIASGLDQPIDVAVDPRAIYFTVNKANAVMMVAKR